MRPVDVGLLKPELYKLAGFRCGYGWLRISEIGALDKGR